ncbi:hypothetical protein FA15DRAFT_734061 [Coprinopsis marcescibilis]|nr:hypothetical protein FA15DRAFT_734061 [Coprinopsis marcescibilis]
MLWKLVLGAVALVDPAAALIRFSCSQLVTQRLDPLVTPGQVSPHVHQIVGGNAFNITMDRNNDLPTLATCTSCRFKENKSNYWTAVLYFKHENGSFIRVPQIPNHFTGEPHNGGITIYYNQPPGNGKVTAFPKGFRMITGEPMSRRQKYSDVHARSWALTWRCWDTTGGWDPSNLPYAGPGSPVDTFNLPNKLCRGGIRSNIFFPSCWDGVNLDSPDHQSHVAFLEGPVSPDGLFESPSTCPPTHPVRIPMIFFEISWDTKQFNHMWPKDGSNPFVMSTGDPTGYGHHGDYVFGWEGDSLQRAMDKCYERHGRPEACKELTMQTEEEMDKCALRPVVNEAVEDTWLPALPGCNPIQSGPEDATLVRNCPALSTTGYPAEATPAPAVVTPV